MKQETLGDLIRLRRLQLGWTQEDLVDKVIERGGQLRQADVSRLESGKVALPRRERLEMLAGALDLSIQDLLASSGWVGFDGDTRLVEPSIVRQARVEDHLDQLAHVSYSTRDTLRVALEKTTLQRQRFERNRRRFAEMERLIRGGSGTVVHEDVS
jgi:transcriptional regulator with XRE-family HTH domain